MKILILFLIFISIGAIGNYFAIRHTPLIERKKWWLKFIVYVIWVVFMMLGIWCLERFYLVIACLVILIGFFEIFKNLRFKSLKDELIIVLYVLLGTGFILFGSIDINRGSTLYLYLFLLICIYDGFSQITGQLFGKLKIMKYISPNKTLEGFIGGTLVMALTAWFLTEDNSGMLNWGSENKFAIFVAIGAPVGDILSSSAKRYMGIKDFGNYFPGQGGVLDRYDSHIFTGAFYYFVIKIYYYFNPDIGCII